MTQFSSSAKILTSHADTQGTQKLAASFGSRLENLNQEDKYQLISAVGVHLWGMCESATEVQELKGTSYDDTLDLVQDADIALTFEVNEDVKQALILLQNDTAETLAALLPAIAEYARDDDR